MSQYGYDNPTTSHVSVPDVEVPLPTYDEAVGGNFLPASKASDLRSPSAATARQNHGAVYRPTATAPRYDAFGQYDANRSSSSSCCTKKIVIVTLCILIVPLCITITVMGLQSCTSTKDELKGELQQMSTDFERCQKTNELYERQYDELRSQHSHDKDVISDLRRQIKKLEEAKEREKEKLLKAAQAINVTRLPSTESKTGGQPISTTTTEEPQENSTIREKESIHKRLERCNTMMRLSDMIDCYQDAIH